MDYQGGIELIRRSVKDPEINDTKIPTSGHRQLIQLDLISFGCYSKPLPPFNTKRTNV